MPTKTKRPVSGRKAALICLFVCSCAYAVLLSTRRGKQWADEQTWATVVGGVYLTLGLLAVEDKAAASKALVYFSVSGIPMIVRSLWLQLQTINAINDHLLKK